LDEDLIPYNFLRTKDYVDSTAEYWQERDIQTELFGHVQDTSVVCACTFSGGRWRPRWWGRPDRGRVTLRDRPSGNVCIPAHFRDGKLVPVGYPTVHGFNNELLRRPDTVHTRTIEIHEQDRYLIFRPGKRYELFYWDTQGRLVAEK